MEPLKRIFNVLFIIGFVWMIVVGGFLFSYESTFADGFDGIIAAIGFSAGPLVLLFCIRYALLYIIVGKK